MTTETVDKQDTSTDEGKNSEPVEKNETETTSEDGKNLETVSPKQFSQEQVNKLMGDVRRTSREKGEQEALKNLLGTVGVDSVDDLTGLVEEYTSLKEANMSEQERINAELEDLKAKNEALVAQNEEVLTVAQTERVKSAVVSAAAGRFESPEAAYKLLEEGDVSLTDGGEVEGVEEALTSLLERYPFLAKKAGTSRTSVTNPEAANQRHGKTDEERKQEYFGIQGNSFWKGQGMRRVKTTEE